MNTTTFKGRRWVRWGLIFGFWTGLGLFFTTEMVLSYTSRGNEADWASSFVYQMGRWYAWGLLTPLMLGLAHRYRIERPWRRGVLIHVGLGMLVAPVQVVLSQVLRYGAFLLLGAVTMEQVAEQLSDAPILILIGSDDGPGLTNAQNTLREGVGLTNTRQRLTQLYGPTHRFDFTNAPDGGLEVNLELPFRV